MSIFDLDPPALRPIFDPTALPRPIFDQGGPAPYVANASMFDGSNDYMTNPTALLDQKDGTFSGWLNFASFDATSAKGFWDFGEFAFNGGASFSAGLRFTFAANTNAVNALGKIVILGVKDGGGASTVTTFSAESAAVITRNAWHHIYIAWQTATATLDIFIDGVSQLGTITTFTNDAQVYSGKDPVFGALKGPNTSTWARRLNAGVAELWFDVGAYWPAATYVPSFRDAGTAKPKDLGIDGSTPTGVAPDYYLNDPAATFGNNKALSGNFTIIGALVSTTGP